MAQDENKKVMNTHLEDARADLIQAKGYAQTDEEKTLIESAITRVDRLIQQK